jgi:predicted amidophosphoribosyltransferase
MDVVEISSNPHSKEDPKTHLSIDPPLTFKEPQKNVDEPPWRPCRQCGHPFSKMNDVCPKCGINQKEPTWKSLVKMRAREGESRWPS